MVTPQPRVMVQQSMVTIPPSGVTLPQLMAIVVQQPPPSMWTSQVQNPSNVPFQSIVESVKPPLVDENQSLAMGQ